MFPLSVIHYRHSLEAPDGLLRTLGAVELVRDFYGRPLCACGANVAVFRIRSEGKEFALRCPLRPSAGRERLWRTLAGLDSPLMPRMEYLPGEVWVWDDAGRGMWCDVQRVEWIEGRSLDACVRDAAGAGDTGRLRVLALAFDALALALLAQPWAHGDLKPENVIVTPDGTCRLVDFDAAWLPGVPVCSSEGGTPGYVHPSRGVSDRHADDYPAVLIAVSLHALALDPELYVRYNDSDRLIFSPEEILAATSAAYGEVSDLFARRGHAALYRLARLLTGRRYAVPEAAESLDAVARASFRVAARTVGGMEKYGSSGTLYVSDTAAGYAAGDELRPDAENGAWGFRDAAGRWAVAPVYDRALAFGQGLAAVVLDGRWHYVDRSGEAVLSMPECEAAGTFREGAAPVCCGGRWGYLSREGRWIVEPCLSRAGSVRGGRVRVVTDEGERETTLTDLAAECKNCRKLL